MSSKKIYEAKKHIQNVSNFRDVLESELSESFVFEDSGIISMPLFNGCYHKVNAEIFEDIYSSFEWLIGKVNSHAQKTTIEEYQLDQLTAYKEENKSLREHLEIKKTLIGELKEKCDKLENTNGILKAGYENVKKDYDSLEKELEELAKECGKLKQENGILEKENESHKLKFIEDICTNDVSMSVVNDYDKLNIRILLDKITKLEKKLNEK